MARITSAHGMKLSRAIAEADKICLAIARSGDPETVEGLISGVSSSYEVDFNDIVLIAEGYTKAALETSVEDPNPQAVGVRVAIACMLAGMETGPDKYRHLRPELKERMISSDEDGDPA